MFTRHRFLDDGENRVARLHVFWTNHDGLPAHMAKFEVTDRRLLVIQSEISPYWALALPITLLIGLVAAHWLGAVFVLAVAILIAIFGPRKLVDSHALGDLAACTLNKPSGGLRFFQREVVSLGFSQGDSWRLSSSGRGAVSAKPLLLALSSIDWPEHTVSEQLHRALDA